jgi:hypothetical protein
MVAVATIALLFIASYAGALHNPRPDGVPVVVAGKVSERLAQQLGAGGAFAVERVPDAAAAQRTLGRRDAYAAVVPTGTGLEVQVSQAASASVARLTAQQLPAALIRAGGGDVQARTVRPLPAADSQGLVAFYLAVGWVIAGYLGATGFGLAFGTSPQRHRVALRLAGLLALGLLMGIFGTLIAGSIADYDHGFWAMAAAGVLTVLATGAATVAFQSLLGFGGTLLAILVFVVLGNPAAGGPYPGELLPSFWSTVGPLLPPGAATTAIRDAAYFPDAPLTGPLLTLLAWGAAGAAVALAFGPRGRVLSIDEEHAALGGAVAA